MKAYYWITAALCLATNAWASQLGLYTHTYGNQPNQVDPTGNDTLSNGYVTVQDRKSQAFHDTFVLTTPFKSIDYFELTLTYSDVSKSNEIWYVTPGKQQGLKFKLTAQSVKSTTPTLQIDASLGDEFERMFDDGVFDFGFVETTDYSNKFKLYSATLAYYGEASVVTTSANGTVPEPASLTLLGLGLAGLGLVRRRRQKD